MIKTTLNKPLKWALALSVVATLAALAWPGQEVVVAQGRGDVGPAPRRVADSASGPAPPDGLHWSAAEFRDSAALSLSGGDAGSGAFDPFTGVVPPPPPAVEVVVPTHLPPPPPPPVTNYRFMGRVTAPDGSEQIFLTQGAKIVAIANGTELDNISPSAIELTIPSTGLTTSIPIERSTP